MLERGNSQAVPAAPGIWQIQTCHIGFNAAVSRPLGDESLMSEKETGSHLRLASENSQHEVEREWARQKVEQALRELAANIIRVVRGAGRSHEIGDQCIEFLNSLREYRDQVGQWPTSWEFERALSIRRSYDTDSSDWERRHYEEDVVRGALQVAASRLVGQLTQESRGRSDMSDGIRELERLREEYRKQRAADERARRRAAKPNRPKRKPQNRRGPSSSKDGDAS